jgi:MFS transporter, Spinster family, sphingosine-1-phosphate transporter
VSEPPQQSSSKPVVAGATFAIVVLTSMNMLNYIDRWVPSAVKELFQKDLNLTEAETSLPLTSFIFVYMLASPVFGMFADRGRRPVLIADGVAIWSLATAAAAGAQGFYTLLLARACVGIGEAAYAVIAPSLISDFYPVSRRNRILTLFYVATPVGSAIGFGLGGFIGGHLGWRAAFLICGLPGLLVALLALFIKDPPRGQFDDDKLPPAPSWGDALKKLRMNKQFVVTVAGYTAVSFATGGIADWFPTFLVRERAMEIGAAGLYTGVSAVVGGILGTIIGGLLADRAKRWTRQPYLAVSGLSIVPATIIAIIAIYALKDGIATVVAVVLCQVFLWMYNGPVNTVLVNSVDPGMRARAFGVSIFCIHAFGDAVSPPIIGKISDMTDKNLPLALVMVPIALAIGAIIWIVGWRTLPDKDHATTA